MNNSQIKNDLEVEIWLPIPLKNFEGDFEISNFGNFRGLDRFTFYKRKDGTLIEKPVKAKIFNQETMKSGHKRVQISDKNNYKHRIFVHQLVALAFIPNPNNFIIVRHLDNNPANNCVWNLKWDTQSNNIKQAYDEGRMPWIDKTQFKKGQKAHNTKLCVHIETGIFYEPKEAAELLGVKTERLRSWLRGDRGKKNPTSFIYA